MLDKKAVIFYFLMSVILYDFATQIKRLSYTSVFEKINNPLFSIVHTSNTGGAFSIFENSAFSLSIIGFLTVFILIFYIVKYVSFNDKLILLASTFFTAGTIGNALERLQTHMVYDYIKLNFMNFPIFNSYDLMISFGVFLYFIFCLFEFIKAKNENSN